MFYTIKEKQNELSFKIRAYISNYFFLFINFFKYLSCFHPFSFLNENQFFPLIRDQWQYGVLHDHHPGYVAQVAVGALVAAGA